MGKEKKKTSNQGQLTCLKCDKPRRMDTNFYLSSSSNYPKGRYPICKKCLLNGLDTSNVDQVQNLLLEMNKPYIHTIWVSSVEEGKSIDRHPFGLYIKNVNLNFRNYTWRDSQFNKNDEENKVANSTPTVDSSKDSKNDDVEYEIMDKLNEDKNKDDVLRMLGYDPFEFENPEDKRHLYNKLVDFLDESTLEDSFKLPAVIEIVKSFNQIDKINKALSKTVNDIDINKAGGIKSLIDSKQKMLKSVLDLAKDNGISVNHNNNKSKGAGTLSGIIKQLQEKGFEASEVNLFDIETNEGIRQVADISNESIVKQLQFDENDYVFMIQEQKEIIENLTNEKEKFEEESRKLKKELLEIRKGGDM
jgi:hypothetical protein